jgi:(1->4)-alpha-D-glucan 1-alpha-D-glucosylmutase
LEAEGSRASNILGYVRQRGTDALAVVVPRLWAGLTDGENLFVDAAQWGDTSIGLPEGRWRNVITGDEIETGRNRVGIGDLIGTMPFAVLKQLGDRRDQP